MSFREKSAWISFLLVSVLASVHYWNLAHVYMGQLSARSLAFLTFGLFGALIVLEIVLHLAVALQAPSDARAPKDERDRLIRMMAARNAFYVLLPAAFFAIFTGHLGADAWDMAQAILFGIVVAELVRFGSQVVLYRRGA